MNADATLPSAAVAVITRTRLRPLLLPRARASVTSQGFDDVVWIVVNDGGDPRPVDTEVALAQADGLRAVAVHRQQSSGMEAASNAGIRACTSRYIVIHDDDDSWEPGFLSRTLAALECAKNSLGIVTHSTTIVEQFFGEKVIQIGRRPQNPFPAVYLADLARRNLFPPISFVFRREIFDAVGGFEENFPVLGDWRFNLKVAIRGDILVLPERLANYHVRTNVGAHRRAYANSVAAERALHEQQDAMFRNELLRRDIASGTFGLGWIVALARFQRGRRHRPDWPLPWHQSAVGWCLAAASRMSKARRS